MPRQIYPRPPIVEAIITFRFADAVTGQELNTALFQKLQTQYAGSPQTRDNVEIEAKIGPSTIDTSSRRTAQIVFLRSNDGLRLLGCGENTLSVHVLAPYPGWERFIEQAREAVNALPEIILRRGLAMVGIRYIDRVTLPSAGSSISDYLTITPSLPDGMPKQLSNFHSTLHSADPADGTVARLTIASMTIAGSGIPGFVYDLAVHRNGSPRWEFEERVWLPHIEQLHERLRDIFEASINNNTRGLFQ